MIGKHFRVPVFDRLQETIESLSFVERIMFYVFAILLVVSTGILLWKINSRFLVEIPAPGGSIVEGVVGAPRFINPLLSVSGADRDLTQLVYSGLMKATPDGQLIPDLADSYTISDDGLRYTFTLRENTTFHDGSPVRAEDVVYTVELAQDSRLKSPKRANWEGVLAEALDVQTIQFTLSQPYQPFLENTTMGILPKHIWDKTPTEQHPFVTFNVEPIGSGPYKISGYKRDSVGVPKYYELIPFGDYALGNPYVEKITLRFFANEDELLDAFDDGNVGHINSVSPTSARGLKKDVHIETFPLPRVFGVFLNQSEAPVFTNIEVRIALEKALDKKQIVDDVLSGYGAVIDGPLPPGLVPSEAKEEEELSRDERIAEARNILERNGWKFSEDQGIYTKETKKEDFMFSFSISTANTEELKRAGEMIKETWEEVGASVELKLFDTGNLNNEVIRPRDYQALLFGQIIGRDLDPFPFWHSSQRNDPGLNIALYTNIEADQALEDIRTTFDKSELQELYRAFEAEVANDVPAIFMYTPDFIYVVEKKIKGLKLGTVTTPAERFLNVHKWHINTDHVWKIFE